MRISALQVFGQRADGNATPRVHFSKNGVWSEKRQKLFCSLVLRLSNQFARSALNNFTGAARRFEYRGETPAGARVYDDYAHHPTAVRVTLEAAREQFPEKKISVVFQPHLYSRTKTQLDDFVKSFDDADEVVLLPIFPAREAFDPTISSSLKFLRKTPWARKKVEELYVGILKPAS